jgi:hypothetical protein
MEAKGLSRYQYENLCSMYDQIQEMVTDDESLYAIASALHDALQAAANKNKVSVVKRFIPTKGQS